MNVTNTQRMVRGFVGIGLTVFLLAMPRSADALVDQFVKLVASWNAVSQSYAVVIGIDAYTNTTNLNYAVNDAQTMVTLLESLGFIVPKDAILLRKDLGDEEVVSKVLQKAGPKDRVIVFYAGHGKEEVYTDGTEAYLLPSNYNQNDVIGTALACQGGTSTSGRCQTHLIYSRCLLCRRRP